MYSSWMPQNVQKRLLLYVLQQLALFSAIDLPNLEQVSLNNIHLKDVSIDPKRLGKLPGFCLQQGVLRDVFLSGGMVDGVNLEVVGIDIELIPSVGSSQSAPGDGAFLLAQSTADLAKTVIFSESSDEATFLDSNASVDFSAASEILPKTSTPPSNTDPEAEKKTSPLSGVMAKAVDIALLRLHIHLRNINISVVVEPVKILILIPEVSYASVSGLRNIAIKGLTVFTMKAGINPGNRSSDVASKNPQSHTTEFPSEDSNDTSTDNDDSDNTEDPLTSSMIFTHEEASLIYMSATSQSFVPKSEPPKIPVNEKTILVYIDRIEVSFEGAMPPKDLEVNVTSINIAVVPLLPTLSLVLSTLSKLFRLKTHDLIKQKSHLNKESFPVDPEETSVFMDQDSEVFDDEEPSNTRLLNKIKISEISFSLTSAINVDGMFSSYENDMTFHLSNCTMKQKHNGLLYGGIEKVELVQYRSGDPESIFRFSADGDRNDGHIDATSNVSANAHLKADFRFEVQKKHKRQLDWLEITILFSKSGKALLDAISLLKIVSFSKALSGTIESISSFSDIVSKCVEFRMKPKENTPQKSVKNVVTLQTSSFLFLLSILEGVDFTLLLFPISYLSEHGELSIKRINFGGIFANSPNQIFTIPHLRFKLKKSNFTAFEFNTSESIPKQKEMLCFNNLLIGPITGSIIAEHLRIILHKLPIFVEDMNSQHADDMYKIPVNTGRNIFKSSHSEYLHSRLTRRANLSMKPSVNIHEDSKPISFRLHVELISFRIAELFPRFGDLSFLMFDIKAFVQNSVYGHVSSVFAKRINNGVNEVLLKHTGERLLHPLIFMKYLTSGGVPSLSFDLRHFYFEYYATWLKLFENDVSQGHDAEKIADATPNLKSAKSNLVVAINISNFAIGLTPLQLPSKVYIAIGKGCVDFTSSKTQFYVKSSFKELLLFLIDDIEMLSHSERNNLGSIHKCIADMGFVEIGAANSSHVGVTITTDIEEIKRRNVDLGISGELPLIDAKLNSDDQRLDLCGDSAFTLIQTLNNLKEPIVLEDKEKFRTRLEAGFKLPSDIQDELNHLLRSQSRNLQSELVKKEQKAPQLPQRPVKQNQSDDFFIVDEYYDGPYLQTEDQVDISQLKINTSSGHSEKLLLNVVESHFAEKLHRTSPIVVPFKLNINLSKVQIFLFDGYDWKFTRKALRKTVKSVEEKALEASVILKESSQNIQRSGNDDDFVNELAIDNDNDEDDAIGADSYIEEVLYRSIHITSKPSNESKNLIKNINSQLQNGQERSVLPFATLKDLKLARSHVHKVMVDLKSVELNVTNFTSRDPRFENTPSSMKTEIINKIEVRVDTLVVYDNVFSSTWNKFLTYMSSLGEREVGTNMFLLNIMNIRPDPTLPYSEATVSINLLPIRLYADQDTLEFLTRFFGFKDSRFDLPVDEIIYFQKLTVEPLKLKFDYKPKRLDYDGLRSGNHAEWANLFTLNGSTLSLERAIIHGAHGLPDVGAKLGLVYGPYIQKCQLAGILSGIGPVRTVFNFGKGVQDLVAIPFEEYRKDGRLLYGLQKGTKAFAKATSYEILRLGINLASGLQVALETLEDYFAGTDLCNPCRKTNRRKVVQKHSRGEGQVTLSRKPNKNLNLMESSHNLMATAAAQGDTSGRQRKYSMTAIDEGDDLDDSELQPSVLLFDPASGLNLSDIVADEIPLESENEYENEYEKKAVSPYSNQPKNTKEGLKLAYKSIGKSLGNAKERFLTVKHELKEADSVQDLFKVIAKSAPILVIRPIIGSTEAMMKTLMGISNEIDSKPLRESYDKYRRDVVAPEET